MSSLTTNQMINNIISKYIEYDNDKFSVYNKGYVMGSGSDVFQLTFADQTIYVVLNVSGTNLNKYKGLHVNVDFDYNVTVTYDQSVINGAKLSALYCDPNNTNPNDCAKNDFFGQIYCYDPNGIQCGGISRGGNNAHSEITNIITKNSVIQYYKEYLEYFRAQYVMKPYVNKINHMQIQLDNQKKNLGCIP